MTNEKLFILLIALGVFFATGALAQDNESVLFINETPGLNNPEASSNNTSLVVEPQTLTIRNGQNILGLVNYVGDGVWQILISVLPFDDEGQPDISGVEPAAAVMVLHDNSTNASILTNPSLNLSGVLLVNETNASTVAPPIINEANSSLIEVRREQVDFPGRNTNMPLSGESTVFNAAEEAFSDPVDENGEFIEEQSLNEVAEESSIEEKVFDANKVSPIVEPLPATNGEAEVGTNKTSGNEVTETNETLTTLSSDCGDCAPADEGANNETQAVLQRLEVPPKEAQVSVEPEEVSCLPADAECEPVVPQVNTTSPIVVVGGHAKPVANLGSKVCEPGNAQGVAIGIVGRQGEIPQGTYKNANIIGASIGAQFT